MIVSSKHLKTLATARDEARDFLRLSRSRKRRTMRQFAEEEIILPSGPFEGRTFRCDRQPFTAVFFDLVDSGQWNRIFVTGPSQSGKSVSCFSIPILYHLFEIGERVICGLPDMDMAADKWRDELLPVIERTRFAHLIPRSRGGSKRSIKFHNGAVLRFMSGGGGDKSRAAFTSRVIVMTEIDGMDESGGGSREADKITQLEARTRAYGSRKRIYGECTVTVEEGRTWREYTAGTRTQLYLPCPHCKAFVVIERENLCGHQAAMSKIEAQQNGAFACPSCGETWSEDDRRAANRGMRPVHRDQTIEADGSIIGPAPPTDTLGFRWSGAHNLFFSSGELAADEWRLGREEDEENAEKESRQFIWAIPYKPPTIPDAQLSWQELMMRQWRGWSKGRCPADAEFVTAGVDLGKWLAHWLAIAWMPDGIGHIVDYGRFDIATDHLGVETATLAALREFRDAMLAGFPVDNDQPRVPDQVWIDTKWKDSAAAAFQFVRESGDRFRPYRGRSAKEKRNYNRPKKTGGEVRWIGEGMHIELRRDHQCLVVEIDADHWKTWLHDRLAVKLLDENSNRTPGSLSLYHTATPKEHQALVKHLTAERKMREFVAGKGEVIFWDQIRKQNHWLDTGYAACAAAWMCGVRLIPDFEQPRVVYEENPPITTPDGRAFLITERE